MRKKLFLVLVMVAMLCCLLAVTVSAKHEYTPLTEDSLSSLNVTVILTDGTSEFNTTINFKDLFNYTLETDTYALKLSGIKATTVTANEIEYTLKTSMVGIYFPDGITHLNTDFMKEYSTVFSKAYLPDSIEFIGDCVFYKCGTFSFIDENGELDNFLPENLTTIGRTDNWGSEHDHFLSGCTLQNSILVFPEGLTSFNGQYSFNDGYSNSSDLHLVFLGEMTAVDIASYPTRNGVFLHFAKNDASDAKILAGGSECNTVEAALIDGTWCYAYSDATTGTDLSRTTDNTGKTLTIKIANNDPNSESSAGAYNGKNWRKVSSIARKFYFCSGEMILSMRNGTFGYKVYISDVIETDDVHPFEDNGVVVDATCTIGGGTRYSCGACGAFLRLENETSEVLGHSYTEENLVSSTVLTCTQDETKTYNCTRCNEDVTVIITEASGHDYSVITYPVEATFNSLGTKKTQCANCTDYLEFTYRLDPGDDMAKVVLDDGTELEIKASELFVYTFDETNQTANISGFNNTTFTVGEKTFTSNDIHTLYVPFGFTGFGSYVSKVDIEVFDLSLTKDFLIGSEAFRDNSYIEGIVLGDGTVILANAFRCPVNFSSFAIADNANVVFSVSTQIFNDIRHDFEIVIGKNATVNFAKEDFTTNSGDKYLTRLVIGDGSTVIFGKNSFNGLSALDTITVGEGCNVSFGQYAFGASTSITNITFPASSTVSFTGNEVFKSCTALESVSILCDIDSIPAYTFSGCTALKTVVLMGVDSMGNEAFATSSDTSALTVYHHGKDAFTYTSSTFNGRTTNGVVLYTLSDMNAITTVPYTIYSGLPHVQTEFSLDRTCTEDGYIGYITDCACGNVIYGAEYVTYTSDEPEGVSATLKEIEILESYGGHDLVITIKYESGFDKEGVKSTACSRACGVEFDDEVTKAIITHKGYSYNLDGSSTGIWSGFHVELDALNEYELYNRTTLNLGVVIVNPKYLGDTFFKDGKVNASGGSIQVDMTGVEYSEISCVISGFQKSDALAQLELVIMAYAYDEGKASSVELIQKSYEVGEDAPIVSKVVKTDKTLYTVNITNVKTPVALPAEIKDYGSTDTNQ